MKPGSGTPIYGLTIAKFILHNDELIKLANEIKKEFLKEPQQLLNNKTSNIITIYVHECHICKKSYEKEN